MGRKKKKKKKCCLTKGKMQALARPIQIITTASIELPKCLLANCKLMCVPLGEEFGQQQALSRLGGCRTIKRSKSIKNQVNCECNTFVSFLFKLCNFFLSNYFHLRANLSLCFLLFLLRLCYRRCKHIELVENKSRNQLKCRKRRK